MRNSFDPDMVRALAAILDETGLTEIEVTDKDNRIRVARTAAPAMMQAAPALAAPMAAAALAAPAAAAPAAEAPMSGDPINSPMVGIAYLSPEPGAPPYVLPGQQVSAGQTLLLIEAMKTFNQVKAPKTGTITRILVAAGAPVEYGEPLMIIE